MVVTVSRSILQLTRPGGPGGSGVDTVVGSGDTILKIFNGTYNLVGFDPRGVQRSGPHLSCFPDKPKDRSASDLVNLFSQEMPLESQFQYAKAVGERCSKANARTAAKYVSTSAVVQDM